MRKYILTLIFVALLAGTARAQSGSFTPIPNYSGIGAGAMFRNDINNHFGGVSPIQPLIQKVLFAQLPAEKDGLLEYCSDCSASIPCTGGGTGNFALGQDGEWACTSPGGDSGINTVPVVHNPTPASSITLAVSSATDQMIDHENVTLVSGGVVATTPAASAMANGQEFEIEVTQPTGSHDYQFAVAAGAGVTLDTSRAGVVGGGQCAAPASTSGAPAYLDELWWWNSANDTLALMSCTYTDAPSAVVTSGVNTAVGTSVPAALNGFNVGGVVDVTNPAYGAVCSDTSENATTSASNPVVSFGAIGDFQIGEYVKLDAAGASNTLSTPTISSVTDDGYLFSNLPDIYAYLNLPTPGVTQTANGYCTIDAGTANHSNTSCSTTYCYSVQNVGQTGIGSGLNGMRSAASTAVCDTTAPASPSIGNAILITWSIDSNTAGTIIRRCTGTSCTPSSIYAIIGINQTAVANLGPLTSYQYRDEGFPYGIDEEASTSAVAADLDAKITGISGTSVTLSTAPSQTITGSGTPTRHDNSPAMQAAWNASYLFTGNAPNYSIMSLPACSSHYHMAQAVSGWGTAGAGISGAGRGMNQAVSNTQLVWDGPPGGIMFNLNYTASPTIENIGVEGQAGNTPGVVIDEDRYPNSSPTPGNAGPGAPASSATTAIVETNLRIHHVECGTVGLCVNLGGFANDENAIIDDLNCSTPNGVGGQTCIYSDSQETYNEAFYNLNCNGRDYCFDFPRIGSFVMTNTSSEVSGILFLNSQPSSYGRIIGGQEEGAQLFSYLSENTTFSDFRVAPGGGPWAAIDADGNQGAQDVYENIATDEVGSPTTSANWVTEGTFIADSFGQPLSFLGITGEWGGGTSPITPGTGAAGSSPFIPVTNVNGSAIPGFTCVHCFVNGQTVPPIFSNEAYQATAFNSQPTATALSGTAGTAACSMSLQGTLKTATCYLNAYQETSTAQTYSFPTAFSTTPILQESGGSCGTYNPTVTASTLTLPANASMTAETCNIVAIGQ